MSSVDSIDAYAPFASLAWAACGALLSTLLFVVLGYIRQPAGRNRKVLFAKDTTAGGNACILSVGTALPPNKLAMAHAAETMSKYIGKEMSLSEKVSSWVVNRIEGSAIETRWTVCPNLQQQFAGTAPGLYGDAPNRNPCPGARNDVWIEEATKLAVHAAKDALRTFKGTKNDITHVLFHSCTGFKAPGIELDIIEQLQLQNVVRKFGVNFMGCFGGFTILQTAKYICEAEPGSHVLCVCAELCTIHQSNEDHRSAQMGIVLFGDAAAAVIVGPGNAGDWAMTRGESVVLPKETKGSMTWRATDHAYRMWLDKTIGANLGMALRSGWKQWFEHALDMSDPTLAEWAVHPGGKAILDAVYDPRVGITGTSGPVRPEHLRHSYSVLREVGNVSSCTILFVLQRMLRDTARDKVFVLGFGPGLTVEYMGLRKLQEQMKEEKGTPTTSPTARISMDS